MYNADPLGFKLQLTHFPSLSMFYEGVGVGILVKFVVTLSLSSCLSHLSVYVVYSYAHALQVEKRKLKL